MTALTRKGKMVATISTPLIFDFVLAMKYAVGYPRRSVTRVVFTERTIVLPKSPYRRDP